jgi:hypothetical protein
MDPIREVTIIKDQARNGDWPVECLGSDNAGYVTIFAGPDAGNARAVHGGGRCHPGAVAGDPPIYNLHPL